MLGPWPQAHPTVLMLASGAFHVVAPLIFLNRFFASRAGLRVGHDPLHI